jgi:hypothetical protein
MYSLSDAFSLAHIATALIIIAFALLVIVNRRYLNK